jgi:hypothetical protein
MLADPEGSDTKDLAHPLRYPQYGPHRHVGHDDSKLGLADLLSRHAAQELAEHRVDIQTGTGRSTVDLDIHSLADTFGQDVDEVHLMGGRPSPVVEPRGELIDDPLLVTSHLDSKPRPVWSHTRRADQSCEPIRMPAAVSPNES